MWKPIPGFEKAYEVSSEGVVRSVDRLVKFRDGRERRYASHELAQYEDGFGYKKVTLKVRGAGKNVRTHVHALVALAFHGPRPAGMMVLHGDGNCQNNAASNLRYDTCLANHADSLRHGTRRVGERAPSARLSDAEVVRIKSAKGTMTLLEAATMFGASKNHICNIWNGRRRVHA